MCRDGETRGREPMLEPRGNPVQPVHEGRRDTLAARLEDPRPDAETLLVNVAKHRDKVAFARLFEWFAPRVKGQLMATGLDPSSAEDLAQDVMVNVWRKAHLYDPRRGAASTWIYAMTRNRFLNSLRARPPRPEDLLDVTAAVLGADGDAASPVEQKLLDAERNGMLGRALAQLPLEQRVAIRETYFADRTMQECATRQGIPLGTLKTRVRLALERLRETVNGRWPT